MHARSGRAGLLIVVPVVLAIGAGVLWQIGEPGRRAKRVHASIQPGMTLEQVEGLLSGRYFALYRIAAEEGWRTVPRGEFAGALRRNAGNEAFGARVQLIFMGMAPGRSSFTVEFGPAGRVSSVTEPRMWD